MVLAVFANLTVTLTGSQNIPPQVLRYVDVKTETIKEIRRIGDPVSPQLIIYEVNPSGDILIYDVIQQDILGGIYWRGDELYLRDRLSQYLYEEKEWYQNYVKPILTKHASHASSLPIVVELRQIGVGLAKEYGKRNLAAWAAGSIAAVIVSTVLTGGIATVFALAIFFASQAISVYFTTVNILNEYKFAYEKYPAATIAMVFLLGTQKQNKEIYDIRNKLLENTDKETRGILEELSTEELMALMESAPELFVETLASYIATLKYARTINPDLVDKILGEKGLEWSTVKDFATTKFYKMLKFLKGKEVADKFNDIIERFDKPKDFEKYYELKEAPIKGFIAGMIATAVGWGVEKFTEWWLKVDDVKYAMLNVVGHAEPLLSINEYVLNRVDDWDKGRFCSSDISSGTIPCVLPSISTISSLTLYDQLYENNWMEFWNITYTSDKIAETLSKRNEFKNWIENHFNKKVNDKESLKAFAKERVVYHMKKQVSLMANFTKISKELEDELDNYVKVLQKRIPLAARREQRGSDIVLVLDRSGSMNHVLVKGVRKIDLAKDASSKFVNMLSENDRIALITFSTNAELKVELTNERVKVINNINSLTAQGSTAMGDAMRLALNVLKKSSSDRKVIVLLTDGCHNSGRETPEAVLRDAKEMKIPIFTIGIGTGEVKDPSSIECFNEDILRKISDETGATFYWINPNVGVDELELWRIYARIALGIIDVKPITLFSDIVMPNAVKSHVFEVGDNIERLTTMLSYRGSKLNLELVSPDGDVINSSRPNIIFIEGIGSVLAIVSSPLTGRWEARVIGVDVPPKGEPYILSIGVNALSISPRELSINATQLEREIKLVIRNEGEITASNVTVYVDGPLKDYIYVNPVKFTIGRGENITLDIKVSKPDSYAKRSARIILDNNGFRYVIPVNLILKGLIINAWTGNEIYVGERAVLKVIVFDDSFSPLTNAKVTVSIDGDTIMLNDNGVSPDTIADDGLYAGFFIPTSSGLITLNIRAEKDNYLPAFMSLSLRVLELSLLNLLISYPHNLTRGDPLIINSTLFNVNGNRVEGGSIEAIINGAHHKFVEITPGFYQLKIDTTNSSKQLFLEVEATKRGFLPVKKNLTITILENVIVSDRNISIVNYALLILLVLILFMVFIPLIAYSYLWRRIICAACGSRNRRGAIYCRRCGNRLRS
jgi:Mg-chelatase subunit ChlD/ribosomal protein L40E